MELIGKKKVRKNEGYNITRADFDCPTSKFRSYVFMNIDSFPIPRGYIDGFLKMCCDNKIGGVIPKLSPSIGASDEEMVQKLIGVYSELLSQAEELGVKVAFNLEKFIERYTVKRLAEQGKDIGARVLYREDYHCSQEEKVDIKLADGDVLAVAAYSHDSSTAKGLSDHIENGRIKWHTELGNWAVEQYVCRHADKIGTADYLCYASSREMIEQSFELFADVFEDHPSVISAIYYNDICFNAHNRANWTVNFNDVFKKKYCFDPSPHYSALYHRLNDDETHIKALMIDCRSEMLKNGIIKALSDFAKSKKLTLKCVITEPKLSACSFITGDAMLDNSFSPCALLERSYLYGVNSIKLAASAAYNFNHERIHCEMFRDYASINKDIVMRETMNAFSRGANSIMLHLADGASEPDPRTDSEYCNFIARVQALLHGGSHVTDIAMLYPIYSLHSKLYLYQDLSSGFEYPDTPVDTDYMTLINSLSIYAGHDLTLLHPKTLEECTRAENGLLYLDTKINHEVFRLFVLPSTRMISLASLEKIKEFYDNGGKIIATGDLPSMAFEYTPSDCSGVNENDAKVRDIVDYIFGKDASNKKIIRQFCYNSNDNGGEAFFLYFTRTAADGTNMALGAEVYEALKQFRLPFDILIPHMPRYECSGALNNSYPEFVRLHLDAVIPDGGTFTRLHKRRDGLDIYYFSNTTNRKYSHIVYLRGAVLPELWDPHSGTRCATEGSFVRYRNNIYTRLRLELDSGRSVFIVSDIEKAEEKLKYTKHIPHYLHLK